MSLPTVLTDCLAPRRGIDPNASRLVAILDLSNQVEDAPDAFQRRKRLDAMQEAIQGIKPDLEALAEGILFAEDDDA